MADPYRLLRGFIGPETLGKLGPWIPSRSDKALAPSNITRLCLPRFAGAGNGGRASHQTGITPAVPPHHWPPIAGTTDWYDVLKPLFRT